MNSNLVCKRLETWSKRYYFLTQNRVLSAEIDRLLKLIEEQTADLEELRLALAD
jgi:hypothetical protein